MPETVVGSLAVAGPDERPRRAELVFTRGGLVARLGEDIVPGLYRIEVPKESAKEYGALLGKAGAWCAVRAGSMTPQQGPGHASWLPPLLCPKRW